MYRRKNGARSLEMIRYTAKSVLEYLLGFPSACAVKSQTTKEKWYERVVNSSMYTPIIAIVAKTVLDDRSSRHTCID